MTRGLRKTEIYMTYQNFAITFVLNERLSELEVSIWPRVGSWPEARNLEDLPDRQPKEFPLAVEM